MTLMIGRGLEIYEVIFYSRNRRCARSILRGCRSDLRFEDEECDGGGGGEHGDADQHLEEHVPAVGLSDGSSEEVEEESSSISEDFQQCDEEAKVLPAERDREDAHRN